MASGEAWSDEENAATVAAYFDMLTQELAHQPYVKAERRRRLVAQYGRSEGAYEMKFANISSVLRDLHCLYVTGYKPRGNRQHSLVTAVETHLGAHPEVLAMMQMSVSSAAADRIDLAWIDTKMPDKVLVDYEGRAHRGGGIHTDYVAMEAANSSLGRAGELAVLDRERTILRAGGRPDLAERVDHVSQTRGDGLGYDIVSFDLNEHVRHIEVKTTRRDIDWPMIVSRNEVRVSKELADTYVLARVYQFTAEKIGIYQLPGAIETTCDLVPLDYEALPKASVHA
ncbi:protein NO VEIN domain-containing protein [Acidipropionibacterium timonense]|uniref:DUF3883 domain-containing protein n=1 Tax=Acidipropionibacterium timonense TaxID=2161818 RepID=UPI00102F59EE|nr:DUF3883 domain-containing protein [Acidipropionibacterium timonense]